jgi:hypothetical protein
MASYLTGQAEFQQGKTAQPKISPHGDFMVNRALAG